MNIEEKEALMNRERAFTSTFSRQPLSACGRLSVAAILAAALTSGILAIAIGFPDNTTLLIVTASLFVGAGLAATGFRWMPVLIILLSGFFLYELLRAPFVLYHLTDPKGNGFFHFTMDVLVVTFGVIAFGASIGAAIQNYRQGGRDVSSFRRLVLTGLVSGAAGLFLGALLIGAVAQPGAVSAGTMYTNGVPTVHMNAANFTQSSVTITKGSKLLLVDDVAVTHILANGSWRNGTTQPAHEAGAPKVSNVQVNGNSIEIGPFATAGTYHIYCTVHQGMTLTIIVQ